ncbi:MAG: hypothetical protein FRX49_11421 [Trebouxia sp. A1-2]|nr:MAG: hypothetical protein FRX49_11421 [Trebouxia sp. A1-2]
MLFQDAQHSYCLGHSQHEVLIDRVSSAETELDREECPPHSSRIMRSSKVAISEISAALNISASTGHSSSSETMACFSFIAALPSPAVSDGESPAGPARRHTFIISVRPSPFV